MHKFIGMTLIAIGAVSGNAFAADVTICPKVSEIKSSPYTSTDPNIPYPFNEGYKYTATSNGKTWEGVTMATKDDYLAPKYQLKAEAYDGSICSYGGKTIEENKEIAVHYLKLKAN